MPLWSDEDFRTESEEAEAMLEEEAGLIVDAPLVENLTDLGNARRFALQHGHSVCYVEALGGWLVYDGTRWRRDETGKVYRLYEDTLRRTYEEAAVVGTRKERQKIGRDVVDLIDHAALMFDQA